MTPDEATDKLYQAAESSNLNDAQAAIDAGADVNAKDDRKMTPLHWAAYAARSDTTARLLIDKGADVNAKDCNSACRSIGLPAALSAVLLSDCTASASMAARLANPIAQAASLLALEAHPQVADTHCFSVPGLFLSRIVTQP
jgi:Ankyrin repeats (many copies)